MCVRMESRGMEKVGRVERGEDEKHGGCGQKGAERGRKGKKGPERGRKGQKGAEFQKMYRVEWTKTNENSRRKIELTEKTGNWGHL